MAGVCNARERTLDMSKFLVKALLPPIFEGSPPPHPLWNVSLFLGGGWGERGVVGGGEGVVSVYSGNMKTYQAVHLSFF